MRASKKRSLTAEQSTTAEGCVQGRFAQHVFPGETLETRMWIESPSYVIFESRVLERDAVVLKAGGVTLKQGTLTVPAAERTSTSVPRSLGSSAPGGGLGSAASAGGVSATEGSKQPASKL